MIEGQEGVTWPQWKALAGSAERLGFQGLFRSDHYASLFPPGKSRSLDAWAVICGLAAITTRLRLGTLVSPVTFRHPAVLANLVTTADHISGGRVELGLGAGWNQNEHTAYGFIFPETAQRMELLAEHLEIIHGVWSSDNPVGTAVRVEQPRVPRPVQQPHPPLIMGGVAGTRAARLAAQWADEYNVYQTAPQDVPAKSQRLAAACEAVERDPADLRLSVNANILIGSDSADLESRARRHMSYQGIDADPAAYIESLGPENLVGTPDHILEQIDGYRAAGAERILFQVYPHDDDEAIEMIAERIVGPTRD